MKHETHDTTKAFLLSLGLAALVIGAANASPDDGAAPVEEKTDRQVLDVDRGIRFFLADSPCWGLAADSEARRAMAWEITKAAAFNDVPPLLLTIIVKRESSFDPGAIGSRGEIGLTQVHGLAAKGCDLDTVAGQLDCGAAWLRKGFEACGTWDKAITAYASGSCEADEAGPLFRKVHSRFTQWRRAQAAVDSCGTGKDESWVCKPQPEKCSAAARIID